MPRPVSPRIHVLLARTSSRAVLIRRGPSKHTAVIGWDRSTNEFTLGQWLYGRIYERRCDLSPDGKHLIYFAMNGRWNSAVKGSWTAISRAPYLKAVSLFAKGDCWHGGGLFKDSRTFWMNDGYGHETLEEDGRLSRDSAYPWHESYGGECPGVYYVRLQRDGWKLMETASRDADDQVTTFEKRVNAHWTLRKKAHATIDHPIGRGCYFDTHELVSTHGGEAVEYGSWEWAEVDRSRVLWVAEGKLFSGRVEASGLRKQVELRDFTDMKFERLAAPY